MTDMAKCRSYIMGMIAEDRLQGWSVGELRSLKLLRSLVRFLARLYSSLVLILIEAKKLIPISLLNTFSDLYVGKQQDTFEGLSVWCLRPI